MINEVKSNLILWTFGKYAEPWARSNCETLDIPEASRFASNLSLSSYPFSNKFPSE